MESINLCMMVNCNNFHPQSPMQWSAVRGTQVALKQTSGQFPKAVSLGKRKTQCVFIKLHYLTGIPAGTLHNHREVELPKYCDKTNTQANT